MTNKKTAAGKKKDRIRTFHLLLPLLLANVFGIYCTGCCTSAIVLDTVLLPVYVVYWPVAFLGLYALGSAIQ